MGTGKGNERGAPLVSLALTALATTNAAAASYIGSAVCAFAASLFAAVAIASSIAWLRLGRAKASGAFALVAAIAMPLIGAYGGWLFSSYAAGRRDVLEMRPMKLRLRGNSIRLRLTQGEVNALLEKGRVDEALVFGDGARFAYALVIDPSAVAIGARFANGAITVTVPAERARAWATTDDVGFEAEDGALRILVEKDWQCLKPRDGEDDADAFPHPGTSSGTC